MPKGEEMKEARRWWRREMEREGAAGRGGTWQRVVEEVAGGGDRSIDNIHHLSKNQKKVLILIPRY